uniref:WSC domain-containing protein n=1 Tax=Macrostomum lignano TaxID=282301 RepID=A0A1I8FPQ8_9PLAT
LAELNFQPSARPPDAPRRSPRRPALPAGLCYCLRRFPAFSASSLTQSSCCGALRSSEESHPLLSTTSSRAPCCERASRMSDRPAMAARAVFIKCRSSAQVGIPGSQRKLRNSHSAAGCRSRIGVTPSRSALSSSALAREAASRIPPPNDPQSKGERFSGIFRVFARQVKIFSAEEISALLTSALMALLMMARDSLPLSLRTASITVWTRLLSCCSRCVVRLGSRESNRFLPFRSFVRASPIGCFFIEFHIEQLEYVGVTKKRLLQRPTICLLLVLMVASFPFWLAHIRALPPASYPGSNSTCFDVLVQPPTSRPELPAGRPRQSHLMLCLGQCAATADSTSAPGCSAAIYRDSDGLCGLLNSSQLASLLAAKTAAEVSSTGCPGRQVWVASAKPEKMTTVEATTTAVGTTESSTTAVSSTTGRTITALSGATYIGCYADSSSKLDLDKDYKTSALMSRLVCLSYCSGKKSYKYFGLQNSKDCYCDLRDVTDSVPETDCRLPC